LLRLPTGELRESGMTRSRQSTCLGHIDMPFEGRYTFLAYRALLLSSCSRFINLTSLLNYVQWCDEYGYGSRAYGALGFLVVVNFISYFSLCLSAIQSHIVLHLSGVHSKGDKHFAPVLIFDRRRLILHRSSAQQIDKLGLSQCSRRPLLSRSSLNH
jgi:hypothetical protein